MSKNTNLSFLTDFITADIVNSRVGINNASPQTTFDVTGTGKFSGILTLGSTISNGTYAYTLPSATGTLALTSDIPSVTGYVPYTGATQAVNLGYNSLSASFLRIDGAGPTLGSYLGFKHSTNVTTGADGYTSIYTFGTNTIAFKSVSGATTRDFSFSMASITPGVPGGRTYTLPDADGTIALTSNIPANAVGGTGTTNYLPKFTGSTTIGNSATQTDATGNLMVGSANAGNAGTINVSVGVAGATAGGIQLWAATNQTHYIQFGDGTTGAQVYAGYLGYAHSTDSLLFGTNGADKMTLFSTGNLLVGSGSDNGARLQVSGTSTFGGRLLVSHATSGNYGAVIYNTSATGEGLVVRGGSTSSHSAFVVQPYDGSVSLFNVLATGAATFSSSVNVGGVSSNTDFRIYRTVAPSVYFSISAPGGTPNTSILGVNGTDVMSLNASGNVGIGTPSPVGKLDVALLNTRRFIVTYDDSIVTIKGASDTGAGENLRIIGDNLIFNTNSVASGTERMRITSSGNVGIGTIAPISTNLNSALTIYKVYNNDSSSIPSPNAQLYGNNQSGLYLFGRNSGLTIVGANNEENQIIFANTSTVAFASINTGTGSNSTGGDMYFKVGSNTERMRITSGGNVLIGTTTDSGARLRVNGSGFDILLVEGNSTTNTSRFSSTGGAASRFINVVSNIVENGNQIDIRTHGSTYTETLFGNSMTNAGAIIGQPAAGAPFIIGNYNNGAFVFGTNNTERMRITSGGNVGIGTASPNTKLEVVGGNNLPPSTGTQNYTIALRDPTSMVADVGGSIIFQGYKTSTSAIGNFGYIAGKKENGTAGNEAGYLSLGTFDSSGIPSEKMRITSGGYLKASNNGNYVNATASYHELNNNSDARVAILTNRSTTLTGQNGIMVYFNNAAPNNTTSSFIACEDSSNLKFIVYSNGNVQNTNNSYGAISDAKLKENIEDASPKLDDLMKVKVRNYNLIGDDKKQIGVIAQELEEVFPAMIDESEDFEEVEVPHVDEEGNEILNEEGEVVITKERVNKGTTTKSVKYSVFVPMLIKAMQEQQEQIKELKTEIDSLKN